MDTKNMIGQRIKQRREEIGMTQAELGASLWLNKSTIQRYETGKITKIKVNSKTNSWNIFIDKDELLPVEILEELESKKMLLDEFASKIEIIFNIYNIYI